MTQKRHTKTTLGTKLKAALTDVSVDIFGYEKRVSQNIIKRTTYISNRIQVPKARLFIRIFQVNHSIKAFLYEQDKPISSIPTEDLAYFFLDEQMATLEGVKHKIAFNIKQYFKDFAEANRMDEHSVRIWMHLHEDQVQIRAFQNETFIKHIPLLSLIKYFKQ